MYSAAYPGGDSSFTSGAVALVARGGGRGGVTALLTAPLRMAAAVAAEEPFTFFPQDLTSHSVQGASRSPAKAILVEMELPKPVVQVEEQVARAALGHFPEAMALLALPLLVRPS